jgi:hypothetical protein
MAKLTKRYIEDHLVGAHTRESWARAIAELVLKAAIAQLKDGSAEEVVIDAKFHITPVEADGGTVTRSPCIRTCLVITPTGGEACYHETPEV